MYTILWSTQGGRAKACARRTARILRDAVEDDVVSPHGNAFVGTGYYGSSFDDYGSQDFLKLGEEEKNDDSTTAASGEGGGGGAGGKKLVIMFVSTTGDAEHCDSIRNTWKVLLQKSLPPSQFQNLTFALFSLGDRAYGPNAFCAAGRKLAARLVQLGAQPYCKVGYGDDGTPNGGVFRDLDSWLEGELLVRFLGTGGGGGSHQSVERSGGGRFVRVPQSPYQVGFVDRRGPSVSSSSSAAMKKDERNGERQEWQKQPYRDAYNLFFESQCPATAYRYCPHHGTRLLDDENEKNDGQIGPVRTPPLLAYVTSNTRLTTKEWLQDTRHISFHLRTRPPNIVQSASSAGKAKKEGKAAPSKMEGNDHDQTSATMANLSIVPPLPYAAGDVATILPPNSKSNVNRFISVLPQSLQRIADETINITTLITPSTQYASSFTQWPSISTLRGILTYCADIASLPEREDLRSLSVYCHPKHPMGKDQRNKLIAMSETENAALYGDYVIREKRDWAAVLFDFDSIRFEGEAGGGVVGDHHNLNLLTIEHLLLLLPPIMPRHFSIASAPSNAIVQGHKHGYTQQDGSYYGGFDFDLCVAIVQGESRHKRKYSGLCSGYLSHLKPSSNTPTVRVWIRPGSFGRLPREIVESTFNGEGTDGGEEKDCSSPRRRRHFGTPIMCIGAGTGVAPLRSLLQERESILQLELRNDDDPILESSISTTTTTDLQQEAPNIYDNILIFGCRKSAIDYYYKSEWEAMEKKSHFLRLLTAFSQDQKHKIYVQRVAREADSGILIAKHIVENSGAVYVAGGAKMARAVREEIVECLGKVLPGGDRDAKVLIKKLQRIGKFSVEAWS